MLAGTVEELFRDYFLPLYPEDTKGDLARARSWDANRANDPKVLAHLDDAARIFVELAPGALGVPPADLALDFSDASVHRLSAALTIERRHALAADGAKGTTESTLFHFVIHGAAYVGACIVLSHGGSWQIRRPLWESLVRLASRAGEADLPIFHWWLRALVPPEGGSGATLADRYRAWVEVPCARPEELPILAPESRSLPRLKKARYHALHKYLRAHLPELRDVGEHFPSPERFDELGFASLAFTLVGGGRMLVVHGPTAHGLHAFWLTKEGFEKAAFWACDAFPEPILRVKGEGPAQKIEVLLAEAGAARSFELLWWGP
jgi:hypothetical protein